MAVKEGQREKLGVFDLEFVAVNHSIPDALAVFVRTEAGTLLHTGDFKMDQLPLDGRLTDLRAFARLGEEGVDLFLTDSTNADVPGFTTPELEIAPAIDKVFRHAERRIIVACFSSHVHRVQQVLDAAEKAGRKVAMVGRSMVRNMGIAAELGYLQVPDGILIDIKKIDSLRDDELVLICTGSQGEPMAALVADGEPRAPHRRRPRRHGAAREQPHPRQRERRLPHHQRPHAPRRQRRAQGQRQGARLGPRQRGRAALLLQHRQAAQRPAGPRRVAAHVCQRPARRSQSGVREQNVVLAEDGVVVDLVDGVAEVIGVVECGYVYVDGSSVGGADEALLKDRRILRDEGFITCIVVLDAATGKIASGPEITARGFVEDDEIFQQVIPKVERAIEEAVAKGVRDDQQLQQVIRRAVGSWVGGKIRRRPMIIPVVLQA